MRWCTCAVALLLLGGCGRAVPGSKTTPPEADAAAASGSASAPAASTASEVGPALIVRVHRFGGGPASIDHTLEIFTDGSARLRGYDDLWCHQAPGTGPKKRKDVDTRMTLERPTIDELRALAAHPEVTGFASASPPARAPRYDGVAAEIALPSRPLILVDGVVVAGRMCRLLDLDRQLAARYGTAAG